MLALVLLKKDWRNKMNKIQKTKLVLSLKKMKNGELRQLSKFLERELRERKKKEKDND